MPMVASDLARSSKMLLRVWRKKRNYGALMSTINEVEQPSSHPCGCVQSTNERVGASQRQKTMARQESTQRAWPSWMLKSFGNVRNKSMIEIIYLLGCRQLLECEWLVMVLLSRFWCRCAMIMSTSHLQIHSFFRKLTNCIVVNGRRGKELLLARHAHRFGFRIKHRMRACRHD